MLKIGLAACLTATAGSAFSQAIDPKLIAAAKAEGSVMLYHTQVPVAMTELLKLFEQKFGIHGETVRATGYDLQQRYTSESKADHWVADLIQHSDKTTILELKAMGLVAHYLPSSDASYPDDMKIKGYAYPLHVIHRGIPYNSDKVTAEEVAKLADWKGLLDPIWKGRLGVLYPSGGGPMTAHYMWLKAMPDQFGLPFLKGLAAQNPTVMISSVPTMERVAAGEIDVVDALPVNTVAIYAAKGAPVRIIFPAPTPASAELLFMTAKPPHPNAAKLLTEWLLSKEGQEVWMGINNAASVRLGVTDTRAIVHEKWYKAPTSVYFPADWDDFANSREGILQQWRTIFKYNP